MLYPKIREMRILHDLKQEYVASKLGMSQPEYSRLENGHRHARIEDFRVLSSLYDVSLSTLMMKEGEVPFGSVKSDAALRSGQDKPSHLGVMLLQQEELISHILHKQQQTEEYLQHILEALQGHSPFPKGEPSRIGRAGMSSSGD